MTKGEAKITLHVGEHDVAFSSPDKVYFPDPDGGGITKLEVWHYYEAVAPAALTAVRARPMILKRFVHGITEEPFFQKRVPQHPAFIDSATFHYKSGLSAEEAVLNDAAGLAWIVNLGCIELHAHPVRKDDLEHPDELRIDLDPGPGFDFADVLKVAQATKTVLDDVGLIGWPKTSGSRGVHIWVRIERKWDYATVRKAALALAEEVERRLPGVATATWQKTERHGVLVDYNQNAKDRTTAAAWSVRATPDARVSMPLTWDQLPDCDPAAYTLKTVPALFAAHGDPHAHIDDHIGALDELLALGAKAPKKRKPKKSEKDAEVVITVATAEHKQEALDGLERWKARHADIAPLLAVGDVLIDGMRGESTLWWRVRVHLRNVPKQQRPAPEDPDPNWTPTWSWERSEE